MLTPPYELAYLQQHPGKTLKHCAMSSQMINATGLLAVRPNLNVRNWVLKSDVINSFYYRVTMCIVQTFRHMPSSAQIVSCSINRLEADTTAYPERGEDSLL